jgi:hypothetical protein
MNDEFRMSQAQHAVIMERVTGMVATIEARMTQHEQHDEKHRVGLRAWIMIAILVAKSTSSYRVEGLRAG